MEYEKISSTSLNLLFLSGMCEFLNFAMNPREVNKPLRNEQISNSEVNKKKKNVLKNDFFSSLTLNYKSKIYHAS